MEEEGRAMDWERQGHGLGGPGSGDTSPMGGGDEPVYVVPAGGIPPRDAAPGHDAGAGQPRWDDGDGGWDGWGDGDDPLPIVASDV